jgi:hypothetical protein
MDRDPRIVRANILRYEALLKSGDLDMQSQCAVERLPAEERAKVEQKAPRLPIA